MSALGVTGCNGDLTTQEARVIVKAISDLADGRSDLATKADRLEKEISKK